MWHLENDEARMTNDEGVTKGIEFRPSTLGFTSSFVIRISSLARPRDSRPKSFPLRRGSRARLLLRSRFARPARLFCAHHGRIVFRCPEEYGDESCFARNAVRRWLSPRENPAHSGGRMSQSRCAIPRGAV